MIMIAWSPFGPSMNRQATVNRGRFLAVLGLASSLALSFWTYGGGRTMCETVGLTWRGCRCGVIVEALPWAIITLVWVLFLRRYYSPGIVIAAIALAFAVGSVSSELWILHDENKFIETATASGKRQGRPRAWPNSIAALVYIPGKGVHATD